LDSSAAGNIAVRVGQRDVDVERLDAVVIDRSSLA
jgi:hypothetical protein